MATKLKNLKITKVDFVDEGANPDADINIKKRKDEDGEGAGAQKKSKNIFKRLAEMFAGLSEEDDEDGSEDINKSKTFAESMSQVGNDKISNEIWDITYALRDSLNDAVYDEELTGDNLAAMMNQDVDEFVTTIKACITQWAAGKQSGIAVKKRDHGSEGDHQKEEDHPEDINKSKVPGEGAEEKGAEVSMQIDKSKMTDAERSIFETLEKRYGVNDSASTDGEGAKASAGEDDGVAKSKGAEEHQTQQTTTADGDNDIFKGISPEAKQMIEELKKYKDDAEDEKLHQVAKKYEILGKKDEELFPVLKSLKSNQAAYDQFVSGLDAAVESVEKSGAFSEIGKSGNGSMHEDSAWSEAEAKASEIMKSKGISKQKALDEVFDADPELAEKAMKED